MMKQHKMKKSSVEVSPEPRWELKADHLLSTVLGEDECEVLAGEVAGITVLKPGEDDRVRREQAKLFLNWVLETGGTIEGEQLRYLLRLLDLTQAELAGALGITPGAVSLLISARNVPSSQTVRQLCVLFSLELACGGTISSLAHNTLPPWLKVSGSAPVCQGTPSAALPALECLSG